MLSSRQFGLLVVIAVIALIGAGAAGLFDTRPPSDPAAERLVNQTADATTNVSAYSFTISGSAVAKQGGERRTATYDGHAAFNRSERTYRMSISLDGESKTLFVRGYSLYKPCPYSEYVNVENASYATELPENRSWTTYTMLGGQRQLFDVSRVYDRGTDTVNGTEVRVVEVVPDQSKLSSLSAGVPGDEDVRRMNAEASALNMTLYVSPESDLPVRVVVERRHDGGFRKPAVQERIVYDFTYGPTTVETPEQTVQDKDACPRP
ncbi:hypothetical protein [Halogeometricum borinquense]|uniref:hypothetical protein n=1 Tax=Halogeometricum borinquense TaxID=60847 RepID=UPI001A91BAB6|nr:hypothetical protein [Halogeometricum borinquense]